MPFGLFRFRLNVSNYASFSKAEVKECVELYTHFPKTPSWRGAELKGKRRDNFTLNFTFTNYVSY
jgi:hypothetical protein